MTTLRTNNRIPIFAGAVLIAGLAAAGWFAYQKELTLGKLPAISIKKHAAGGYTLMVDGKPFLVKGVCYMPVPIGHTYDYNFWAIPEIWQTDGKLMKRAGVNSVRFYQSGKNPAEVKAFIGGLYSRYGIRSFMGHALGFWDWPPANYGLPEVREKVKAEVLAMVRNYKDEPGVLGWILGNENNYSFEGMNVGAWSTEALDRIEDPTERSRAMGQIYYAFVNELASEIKKIDPVHPVVMGVGEIQSLEIAAKHAPDIDILGMIVYRGAGFGSLFSQVKQRFDKPVLLIEWGADSYDAVRNQEAQDKQAEFLKYQWRDIEKNAASTSDRGTAIGGMIFEWNDEWWKSGEHFKENWAVHDATGQFSNPAYAYDHDMAGRMNVNEEWYGLVGLEPKAAGEKIDRRVPKKAYETMRELWGAK